MIIKENSWHYRIQDRNYMWPKDRKNLCSYMRGLIIASVMEVFTKVCVPVWLILSPIVLIYVIISPTFYHGILTDIVIVSVLIGTGIDIAILGYKIFSVVGDIVDLKYCKGRKFGEKKKIEPNIFVEWLRAKKQKICPVIEFVKDDKHKLLFPEKLVKDEDTNEKRESGSDEAKSA